ncbi:MAG: 3-phosphoshikimate 1-carboxyvinyltransferase, partial [Schleiferilactobacillus harbinensis]
WVVPGPVALHAPDQWPDLPADHRMAMLQFAAALVAGAPVPTTVPPVVAVSYPELTYDLTKLVTSR